MLTDANYIKEIMTIDDVISVMSELGADYNFLSNNEIHFRSICHNSNSFKLYYYDKSKSLYCHRCGERYDIFGIIQKIKNCGFKEAIDLVCSICRIEKAYRKEQVAVDNWQKDLKKFLPNYEPNEPLKIYDSSILNLFENKYFSGWLDEGITKDTMEKFGIKWYGRNAQIVIPVFDINGNLVGIHARNLRNNLVAKGLKYVPLKTFDEEYKFPTSGVLYGLYNNQEIIKNKKSVIICEAPKSVLKAETMLNVNNAVALFGWNMQQRRRDMLLDLGIEEVTIAIDRQYIIDNGEEFDMWKRQVNKIANLFKPYCNVYSIYDSENLLDYKDSPFDKDKTTWQKLYDNRIKIS